MRFLCFESDYSTRKILNKNFENYQCRFSFMKKYKVIECSSNAHYTIALQVKEDVNNVEFTVLYKHSKDSFDFNEESFNVSNIKNQDLYSLDQILIEMLNTKNKTGLTLSFEDCKELFKTFVRVEIKDILKRELKKELVKENTVCVNLFPSLEYNHCFKESSVDIFTDVFMRLEIVGNKIYASIIDEEDKQLITEEYIFYYNYLKDLEINAEIILEGCGKEYNINEHKKLTKEQKELIELNYRDIRFEDDFEYYVVTEDNVLILYNEKGAYYIYDEFDIMEIE